MSRQKNSLKPWNTFSLEAAAAVITVAENAEQLCQSWQLSQWKKEPTLLLGEGSNVLFIENFSGQVIINRLKGIEIQEQNDAWLLHIGAGENWHQLVEMMLDKGLPGLENLALIPGCAGSAPIQNIGAYGVEFEQLCAYVDVINLANGHILRLTAAQCQFGYRDSIFKHQYRDGFAIVAVGLLLPKVWKPVLSYGDLRDLDPKTVTPRQVFDSVCHMRRSKLPDPKVTGNAGSFFKNPLVSSKVAAELQQNYPAIPLYPQVSGEVKLAAGWLIDQCELKGFRQGGAAVHEKQALVLINCEDATGKDIIELARIVRQRVASKFNVWLEPEVRFIASSGEINAVEALA